MSLQLGNGGIMMPSSQPFGGPMPGARYIDTIPLSMSGSEVGVPTGGFPSGFQPSSFQGLPMAQGMTTGLSTSMSMPIHSGLPMGMPMGGMPMGMPMGTPFASYIPSNSYQMPNRGSRSMQMMKLNGEMERLDNLLNETQQFKDQLRIHLQGLERSRAQSMQMMKPSSFQQYPQPQMGMPMQQPMPFMPMQQQPMPMPMMGDMPMFGGPLPVGTPLPMQQPYGMPMMQPSQQQPMMQSNQQRGAGWAAPQEEAPKKTLTLFERLFGKKETPQVRPRSMQQPNQQYNQPEPQYMDQGYPLMGMMMQPMMSPNVPMGMPLTNTMPAPIINNFPMGGMPISDNFMPFGGMPISEPFMGSGMPISSGMPMGNSFHSSYPSSGVSIMSGGGGMPMGSTYTPGANGLPF